MESHITPAGTSVLDDLGLRSDESDNLKIRAKLMNSLVDQEITTLAKRKQLNTSDCSMPRQPPDEWPHK